MKMEALGSGVSVSDPPLVSETRTSLSKVRGPLELPVSRDSPGLVRVGRNRRRRKSAGGPKPVGTTQCLSFERTDGKEDGPDPGLRRRQWCPVTPDPP